MIKSKNKIYIGSRIDGYLNEEMLNVIFDYLASTEMYELSKAKPKKIKDNYLLELEINEQTKELLQNLKNTNQLKLYKRTHTWEQIYKMADTKMSS